MFSKALSDLAQMGVSPYLATAPHLTTHFDWPYNAPVDWADHAFHQAYILSNALAFENPDITMPSWVYLDCVLMQTAVAGFKAHRDILPAEFVAAYDARNIKADFIPISGQIASRAVDQSWVGFSLFSLANPAGLTDKLKAQELPPLSVLTKFLALSAYRADGDDFIGIAQYDNLALRRHGKFAQQTYIQDVWLPLHPRGDMAFTYRQKIDLDAARIFAKDTETPDTKLAIKASDKKAKAELAKLKDQGAKLEIRPPFQFIQNGEIYLPILCV